VFHFEAMDNLARNGQSPGAEFRNSGIPFGTAIIQFPLAMVRRLLAENWFPPTIVGRLRLSGVGCSNFKIGPTSGFPRLIVVPANFEI
jgi:hypothetical protein